MVLSGSPAVFWREFMATFVVVVVQICEIKPNQIFVVVGDQDSVEYIKIGNTHVRKASVEQGCCTPISALEAGIRTRVEPSDECWH
jgi:hypothetical protein